MVLAAQSTVKAPSAPVPLASPASALLHSPQVAAVPASMISSVPGVGLFGQLSQVIWWGLDPVHWQGDS